MHAFLCSELGALDGAVPVEDAVGEDAVYKPLYGVMEGGAHRRYEAVLHVGRHQHHQHQHQHSVEHLMQRRRLGTEAPTIAILQLLLLVMHTLEHIGVVLTDVHGHKISSKPLLLLRMQFESQHSRMQAESANLTCVTDIFGPAPELDLEPEPHDRLDFSLDDLVDMCEVAGVASDLVKLHAQGFIHLDLEARHSQAAQRCTDLSADASFFGACSNCKTNSAAVESSF